MTLNPVLPLPTPLGESRYLWEGRQMIGITRLLAEMGLGRDYSMIGEEIMEQARDRGIIVHAATAEYDRTGQMPEVSPELIGYLTAYDKCRQEQRIPEPLAVEASVVDHLRGFCCTIDRWSLVNEGTPQPQGYVWEIKTYDPGEEIWLQLAAQAAAVKATYGLKDFPHRAYVWLKPDGSYRFVTEKRSTFAEHLRVVDAAATLWSWRRKRASY